MMNYIQSMSKAGKVLSITFLTCILIVIISFLPIPRDDFQQLCGVASVDMIVAYVVMFGSLITLVVGFLELIVSFIRHRPKNRIVRALVYAGILFLLVSVFAVHTDGRMQILNARLKGEMSQIRAYQENFYDLNGRYAGTQDELVKAGVMKEKLVNLFTGSEVTDKDGQGIEGGDSDPETWAMSIYFPEKKIRGFCQIFNTGYWFTCNQEGCYRE